MDVIKQAIVDWLREILVGGIISNLSGLYDSTNTRVAEIAGQVGTTPAAWNSSIYNMIRALSDNVILPIAGVVLAFVMTLELIQLIVDRNNMHDVDTWMFFKWIFKTACAVLIVTNTWNIVMGVFDLAQSVVNSAAGVTVTQASLDISTRDGFGVPTDGHGAGAAVRAVVPDPLCGRMYVGAFHLHFHRRLRQNGGNLPRHVRRAGPNGYDDEPRMGADRAELSAQSACARLSGVYDSRLRGDIRCPDRQYCGQRRYQLCHLDVHVLYGAALLYAVQNR